MTLAADLPCLRCGALHRAAIELDDDPVPGSIHDVIVDAYCDACLARWVSDENDIALAHLAAAIDRGDVVARLGEQVITADALRPLAIATTVDGAIPTLGARLARAGVTLTEDDMWPELHADHICARLVERGWPPPGDQLYRDDLMVRVTLARTLELA